MSVLEETLKALNHYNDYEPHQSRYQRAVASLLKLIPEFYHELVQTQAEKEPKRKSSELDSEFGAVKAKKSVSIKVDPPKGKSKSQTKSKGK